eukprot:2379200-Amphidinium_carterae.1
MAKVIKTNAKLSVSLDKNASRDASVVAGCCGVVLLEVAQDFLGQSTKPVLFQFGQDSTKVRRKEVVTVKQVGKRSSRRALDVTGDFIVQCLFLGGLSSEGVFEERVLFGTAIPIKYGKRVEALFVLHHLVFDRGVPLGVAEFVSGHWSLMSQGGSQGS